MFLAFGAGWWRRILSLPSAGNGAVMAGTKSRPVVLGPAERETLTGINRTGSHPAQQVRRARILRELDENHPGRDGTVPLQTVVADRAGVCTDTVLKASKAYADSGGGVAATITRRNRATRPVEPKVAGEVGARVVALACGAPPQGRDRWSL